MANNYNITTPKQFKTFCQYLDIWAMRLGLITWNLEYEHRVLAEDSAAESRWNNTARWATIILNKKPPSRITNKALKKDAIHEALHVFMAPIVSLALRNGAPENEIRDRCEQIVIGLTNILFSYDELLAEKHKAKTKPQ